MIIRSFLEVKRYILMCPLGIFRRKSLKIVFLGSGGLGALHFHFIVFQMLFKKT